MWAIMIVTEVCHVWSLSHIPDWAFCKRQNGNLGAVLTSPTLAATGASVYITLKQRAWWSPALSSCFAFVSQVLDAEDTKNVSFFWECGTILTFPMVSVSLRPDYMRRLFTETCLQSVPGFSALYKRVALGWHIFYTHYIKRAQIVTICCCCCLIFFPMLIWIYFCNLL